MMTKDVEMVEAEKLKITNDREDGHLNATYAFNGEDHTLGNLLRSMLIKDQDTQFCGYSVPHPSEEMMNVRLQTHATSTDKVMSKALVRISTICDIMTEKFSDALLKFSQNS